MRALQVLDSRKLAVVDLPEPPAPASGEVQIEIDVQARRVRTADGTVDAPFELDDFTQWRLLEGLDDIGLTLRHEDEIAAHESGRQSWLPSTA